jgi:hypothetical protein
MHQKIIDLNLKRKVKRLKEHPEFRVLNLNFEEILKDIYFFKKHIGLIRKSDVLFNKMFKINRNYSKSVVIQQDFVEEFQKMG